MNYNISTTSTTKRPFSPAQSIYHHQKHFVSRLCLFCLPEQWTTASDFNCLVPGIYFNILRRAQWVTDAPSFFLHNPTVAAEM